LTSSRAIRAGEAYVELLGKDSHLNHTLESARRRLAAFGTSARTLGVSMLAASSAAVAPIAAISIKAASDAEEIRNRFRLVFREGADEAGRFADALGEAVGRSGTRLRATMANFQSFFVGLGFGADQASLLSRRMAELSLDFASFNNLSDDEASNRFIAALSGSGEVLDRFGINIKQAALDLELQRLGLAASTAAADELSKAVARTSIIARVMGDQGAVGDAVRTSDAWANQMRRLNDELFDLRASIGSSLIGRFTGYLQALNGVVDSTRDWLATNPQVIDSAVRVAGAVAAAGAAIAGLGVLALAASNPALLLAGSVAALVGAIAGTRDGRDAFRELGRELGETAGLVTQLLAAGQIEAAAKVAAAGVRLAFLREFERIGSDFDHLVDDMAGRENTRQGVVDSIAQGMVAVPGLFDRAKRMAVDTGLEAQRIWLDFFNYTDQAEAVVAEQDRRRAQLDYHRRTGQLLEGNTLAEAQDLITDLSREAEARESGAVREARREIEQYRRELEQSLARGREARASTEAERTTQAESDRRRLPSVSAAVGSLSASSALQAMFGVANDRILNKMGNIESVVREIARNTENQGVFR
jgi:hypothetical protein